MEPGQLTKPFREAKTPAPTLRFVADPFRATLTTAADKLATARANAERLFEKEHNLAYGRALLRRLAFIEACLQRAVASDDPDERVRSVEFALKKIDEVRELLVVIAGRRPGSERSMKYLRPVLSTTRAVLTAALRLREHSFSRRHHQ
ncbi:MAG: hypothetical protein JOZ50_08250 [Candidatus Eremiobacteraeota bacterium]|nr:hypothetical protein [Candidatus Eremiobacteraeota bacterium]